MFVEALEKCFQNVCEVDVIFNFPKVSLSSLYLCLLLHSKSNSYYFLSTCIVMDSGFQIEPLKVSFILKSCVNKVRRSVPYITWSAVLLH